MAGNAILGEASATAVREIGWTRGAAGLLVGGLTTMTLFLAWRSLGWPLIHDAPLMHYVAWRVGEGAVPYRDLFDMNFPGAYLLHLGVLTVVGSGDTAWRLFDLGWLGGTAALIFLYCRRFGAWSAVTAALLFGAYHLSGGAWQTGQRDYLLVALLLAAAHLVARFWEEGRSLGGLALAGLALGLAMTIKPHVALFWLLLALAAVQGGRRRGRQWRGALTVVIASGLIATGAVVVWFWAVGGLGPFLDIATRYVIPLYSRLGRVPLLQAPHWDPYGWAALGILGGLAVLSLSRVLVEGRLDIRRGLLLAGLGYGIVHYWVQGKGWEYHLYPLVGFACPLAASELDRVLANGHRRSQVVLLGGLLLVAVLLGVKGVEALETGWILDKQRRVESLVSDLKGRVPPGGTVQVLDTTEGGIHALLRLRLRQPTRFLYDFHFFHDAEAPYIRGLRAELLGALRRAPPEFVVVFERGWPRGGFERLAGFAELAAWMDEGYTLDAERDGYRLYARRRDR